jgi:tetratricopeptide (TPR) repeat protein
MFRKIVIALLFLGIVFPLRAEEQPIDLESLGLIPSERKKDMPKGKNPFELVPIEQNSDSKLAQKDNDEDYYIDIAKDYVDKKDFKKAIEFLDKAIILYPKNSQFYGIRAISYAGLNQQKKAIDDYTKSISLDPQSPYFYVLRGFSYYHLKQYEKAINDYTKAINIDPQEASFYNARGEAYKELKQDDKMELDFIKARELLSQDNTEEENTKSQNQENDEVYYFNLGIESIDKKDYKKAIESLDKAINLNSQNSDSYYWRGYAYDELEHYQKAIEDFTKSINLNPQDAPVYYARGVSYSDFGEYQKAKLDLIKASELYKETGNITSYNNVQESLKIIEDNIANSVRILTPNELKEFGLIPSTIQQNERKTGTTRDNPFSLIPIEENSDSKLTQKENDENYYIKIAMSYLLDKKEYIKAIEILDKAIILYPKNSDFYIIRGNAYHRLKQYQKAIENYTKSISLNSQYENAPIYTLRGRSYSELNQYEKAIADYTKSISFNPKNPDNYYLRGYAYHMLKQYQKAIVDQTKSISFNPKNPDNYYWRGYAYNALGDYQKAKLDLIKVSELFKETGDIVSYNHAQESLKIIENNIVSSSTKKKPEEKVDKKTRELLVKRACSMAKQGYTDGEIRNEIYRLVRINTPAPRRDAPSLSIGSYGRQIAEIFDNLRENLDDIEIQDEALNIRQIAKKRCKF